MCPCGSPHAGEAGGYYVSVVDGPRYGLLLGPFSTHAAALGWVDAARREAEQHDPRAAFYAFGTLRAKDDYRKPGRLNARMGFVPQEGN